MKYYTDRRRHLICVPYSKKNLHNMAKALNIHKCWYHGSPYPHYDIPKRRIKEIESLCQIVSSANLLLLMKGKLDAKFANRTT